MEAERKNSEIMAKLEKLIICFNLFKNWSKTKTGCFYVSLVTHLRDFTNIFFLFAQKIRTEKSLL